MSWWDYLREIFAPEPRWTDADIAEAKKWGAEMADRLKPLVRDPIPKWGKAPTREDFTRWLDDPITIFVFEALSTAADAQQKAWNEVSWDGGSCDAELLVELRTRADAYKSLQEGTYEAFCEWLEVDPEPLPEPEMEQEA